MQCSREPARRAGAPGRGTGAEPGGRLPRHQGQASAPRSSASGPELIAERSCPSCSSRAPPVLRTTRLRGRRRPGLRKPSLRIPDAAFQVLRLPGYEPWMTGTMVYSEVFWRHDSVGLRQDEEQLHGGARGPGRRCEPRSHVWPTRSSKACRLRRAHWSLPPQRTPSHFRACTTPIRTSLSRDVGRERGDVFHHIRRRRSGPQNGRCEAVRPTGMDRPGHPTRRSSAGSSDFSGRGWQQPSLESRPDALGRA